MNPQERVLLKTHSFFCMLKCWIGLMAVIEDAKMSPTWNEHIEDCWPIFKQKPKSWLLGDVAKISVMTINLFGTVKKLFTAQVITVTNKCTWND